MPLLEVTSPVPLVNRGELPTENWHDEVPGPACWFKEPGVDSLGLVKDQVEHVLN